MQVFITYTKQVFTEPLICARHVTRCLEYISELNRERSFFLWRSCSSKEGKQKAINGASLVVQWLRIRLPMQGTRV